MTAEPGVRDRDALPRLRGSLLPALEGLCTEIGPGPEWVMDFGRHPPKNLIAVCHRCPVEQLCLEWAIAHHEVGIWGGTSDFQRRKIRQERGLPAH